MERVNKDIAGFIPKIEKYLETGAIKPMEYEIIEGANFEPVFKGLEAFNNRKANDKKLLVRVAEE